MVGYGKIVVGGVTLKAFDRAALLANNENVVNCGFKRCIEVLSLEAPRETIVISYALLGVFGCNIVCVAEVKPFAPFVNKVATN